MGGTVGVVGQVMNLSDLQAVKTIIVHDNCADGLSSAILLHDALPNAEVRFVQYGTPEYKQLKPEPGMLFCDFSPPAPLAPDFVKAGTLILDHHKSAKGVVALFEDKGHFGDEVADPGVCGAVLAYRYVWHLIQGKKRADLNSFAGRFAGLAGIRDTWQSKSPMWDEGCAQVETLNMMTNERWMAMPFEDIAAQWETKYAWIGRMLWEKHMKGIAKAIKGGHRFTTEKGTRVIMFEGVRKTSDAAELLGEEVDLILGFDMFEEDTIVDGGTRRAIKLIFSSRSHTTFDCMALAKAHGGGGHTKAAGFNQEMTLKDPNPYAMGRALLEKHEAVATA